MKINIICEHTVDDRLLGAIESILRKEVKPIMALLDDLTAKVAALKTVDDSVVATLDGLKAKLDEAIASGDPAKLQELSDAIGAETTRLANAVTNDTPAT